jgi:hypothetical protein
MKRLLPTLELQTGKLYVIHVHVGLHSIFLVLAYKNCSHCNYVLFYTNQLS